MATSFQDLMNTQTSKNITKSNSALISEESIIQEEQWIKSNKYTWYNEYSDDIDYSVVDNKKNVVVNKDQINLTQEKNSQIISFIMPRFSDGIDIVNSATINFHIVNSANQEYMLPAVNVSYSETKIRFHFLVDEYVTSQKGTLKFEILATGNTSAGEYVWRTKPNNEITILESLSGNGTIEPGDGWDSYINIITNNVIEAQTAAANANTSAQTAISAVSTVDEKINTATETITSNVLSNVAEKLVNYYTKEEVDVLLAEIDLSEVYEAINNIDGLANFKTSYNAETRELTFYNGENIISTETLNTNPTAEWVTAYDAKVDNKISNAVSSVQSDLDTYKGTVTADLESIHNDIDGLPQTLATDYYNKETTDGLLENKADKSVVNSLNTNISSIESIANINKSNITILGDKVSNLETLFGDIDTSPQFKYDITYDEEQKLTLWEIENEGTEDEIRTAKAQYKILGGGGSGGTSSVLKIEYVTKSPLTVTANDKALIKFNFSGTDSSGDIITEGHATWKVGNSIVATSTVIAGENTFDVTKFLSLGTQKIMLSITDDAGSLVTKSWTIQKVDVRIDSTFNDKLTYPIGEVSFDYTPYGAISKDVHFILDGKELPKVTTSSSGIPMAYTLPSQSHGAHLFEVYMTAEINGSIIESNHIVKDIIWYDSNSNEAVISCVQQNITAKQYDTTNIVYSVYDPKTETPKVTLAVDGVVISSLTLDSNTQTWQYKSSDIGTHILTITCRDTVKTLTVAIEKLGIDIEPVTGGLVFDFNPIGHSNNDEDKLWSNGEVAMTVSDNFDWVNGGYQIDENGDQYFGVKAGTTATIGYHLFSDDAKRNGKEFKLIFKTANVSKADATFLSCIDVINNNKIGLQMNVHEAYVHASADKLYLPYSEEDIIEFEFNINKNTDIPMVMGYEDGVATRPMIYSDSHDFTQINPQNIVIGCADCDVYIYRMKAYNTSLTDRGILNNFIADARNADEMIARYNRNQIYDENNLLTPESLAKACPQLKIIKIDCPHFTNDKKDFVLNTNIECIHTGGDPVLDNWTARNAAHSGQGTTSNEYGAAGRNMDLLMCFDGNYKNKKITYNPDYKTILTLGDGTTYNDGTGKVTLTRSSVPTNYMNIKVNIASSENANNSCAQNRYNRFLPYKSVAQQKDPHVKNSMEFVNCVVFIKENDPDISTHREFQDCEYHYYALGNIGDSKKTDHTRVNDPNDPKEFVVEIMDNTLPNSTFSGTSEALIALDADVFDEEGTYGFRYEMSGISNEQQATNIQTWRNFYRFVATSTDEDFVRDLKNWFIVDSALYFYLFTERYTMIDNRAKNTFWHCSKQYITQAEADSLGESAKYYTIDDEAAAINDGYRFDLWDYDNDTALGINNSGELTMTYGKEDIDYRTDGDPSSGYIFNAAESKFFCRIRDLMYDQLANMFIDRESQNCWSANSLINEIDEWQSQFPEELWRLDIERKYLRTYRDGNTRFLVQMMNGRKKYQRRQFERDQEKYMATKYFGTTATSDQIMFRCNTPHNAIVPPNYTLHLTPYSDIYLSVMFGATYRKRVRAKAGQQYDIECPFTTMDDTAVLVYCASRIQSMGDISACYIHDNDFSNASRLKELIIGNTTEGYQNTFLTNLGIGNNTLLKKLDIQNTPNLVQALNLSRCGNLEELYAHGSGLSGITFADGGKIRIAQLPAISAITMRNLTYLTDLDISAFNNLSTMVIENCGTIDVQDFFTQASNINRVRITGINWNLSDTSLLDKIYKMYGVDKNGYNIEQSVLAGTVHVPVMREQLLADYRSAWSDLDITYDTLIAQFVVIFKNDNGDILEIQYVDKGGNAVDPSTREIDPLIPIKESSISDDFTFAGWDSPLTAVFSERIVTATYTSTLRTYTVKYVSKGVTLQETKGKYGDTVQYVEEDPIYTAEESAYVYHLFNRWDKSGYIDGNKTINAIFDRFEYTSGYFNNKELQNLTPVEIYAMTKLGLEESVLEDKDYISITMGKDYDYDDIETKEIITEKTLFDGTKYIDTGIKLFDEDRDFVLAIDYKFMDGCQTNSVLAQCFQANGSNGIKLWYNNGVKFTWGTSSKSFSSINNREIVVIRHKKGQNNLWVYNSNLSSDEPLSVELSRTKNTIAQSTLVLGCAKADDGIYENYAVGHINWCKLWYADLGEDVCKELVLWTHEKIGFEMCGFKRYYLSENPSKRCSFSLLATHLLERGKPLSKAQTNEGGWANMSLNTFLNNRFYKAFPSQWKQLIKKVTVSSSIGNKSTELSTSDCYVTIPACIDVDPTMSSEPYIYEGSPISYMTTNAMRRRGCDGEDYNSYWLRSPNVDYANYMYQVDSDGNLYGYYYPSYSSGVLIEISI